MNLNVFVFRRSYYESLVMKKIVFVLTIVLFLGCDNSDESILTGSELSTQEIADLQFLKEEEKLARDVYLFSYDLYGSSIFNNISKSEQSHMDKVTLILEKYNIEDLSYSERGKFNNQELQNLYNDLVEKSENSLTDAIVTGATIEDLDINDIDEFIIDASHDDIQAMYEILNCGSGNHLRAYTGFLENLGEEYNPQFISKEAYLSIVESDRENCNN